MELKEFYFVDVERMANIPFRDIILRYENEKKEQIFVTKEIKRDDNAVEYINQGLFCKTLDKFIEKHGFTKMEFGKQWIIKRG